MILQHNNLQRKIAINDGNDDDEDPEKSRWYGTGRRKEKLYVCDTVQTPEKMDMINTTRLHHASGMYLTLIILAESICPGEREK